MTEGSSVIASEEVRRSIDVHVWRACAGTAARVPPVGSLVYYFPQGHIEHALSPPDPSRLRGSAEALPSPCTPARVAGVQFLANAETDEVFAQINLDPRGPFGQEKISLGKEPADGGVVSAAKVLTRSDANNGGGFSVPRFCAENVFPPLDLAGETPLQILAMKDVHGREWKFRHVYRGSPLRHILTTGWSKFVDDKKLVAGDTIVFIKNRFDERFVGLRRASRPVAALPSVYVPMGDEQPRGGDRIQEGASGSGRGRVPADTVVEAVRRAEMEMPFEVMYYPKLGLPEFVVPRAEVDKAMMVAWNAMRVKMPLESEDLHRKTWLHGTVSSVVAHDGDLWPKSPWRMLQVSFDGQSQNVHYVNPWQVEPTLDSTGTMAVLGSQPNSDGNMFFSSVGSDITIRGASSSNSDTFPVAGMQGARHYSINISRPHNFILDVSTSDVNNVGPFQSENLSPQNQGSSSVEQNPRQKDSGSSIRLFGVTIQIPSVEADEATKETDGAD